MAAPLLELELPDAEVEGDGVFEALVDANQRWLGRYARLHPSFSVEPALLARNSLWMNAFFQKSRMTTSAASPQAKSLIKKHRDAVVERLRSTPVAHSESPFSTCVVDPMAALMFAASIDRCPHNNLVRSRQTSERIDCGIVSPTALGLLPIVGGSAGRGLGAHALRVDSSARTSVRCGRME